MYLKASQCGKIHLLYASNGLPRSCHGVTMKLLVTKELPWLPRGSHGYLTSCIDSHNSHASQQHVVAVTEMYFVINEENNGMTHSSITSSMSSKKNSRHVVITQLPWVTHECVQMKGVTSPVNPIDCISKVLKYSLLHSALFFSEHLEGLATEIK